MNYKHGKSGSTEHKAWKRMKARCLIPSATGFEHWGGRGITVCDRWRDSFESFLEDMGACPPGHSLDRIDNDRGYEPGNCRWADRRTQNNNTQRNNRITYLGRTQTLAEWARELGLNYDRVKARIYRGDTPDRAFTATTLRGGTGTHERQMRED